MELIQLPLVGLALKQPTLPSSCWVSATATGFFDSSPWLNIPLHRRGQIIAETLQRSRGLLGGSSGGEEGKMSKLQALAAARQKRGNERAGQPSQGQTRSEVLSSSSIECSLKLSEIGALPKSRAAVGRPRQRDGNKENEATLHIKSKEPIARGGLDSKLRLSKEGALRASPSAFATTILGHVADPSCPKMEPAVGGRDGLAYTLPSSDTNIYAFLVPSPDDVVTTAQNSRG